MELLDYMNAHENWMEELTDSPYSIHINHLNDYYSLKYDQIESDMTLPLVREARGSIFRREGNEWICVARAMDKFGNVGEDYVDVSLLDWDKGVDIQEKVDGSIIKIYYDREKWHIATNNVPDAFAAECGDTTYGQLFMEIVAAHNLGHDFFAGVDTNYCYWFELVSNKAPHVINYNEEMLYFLGCRNMRTMKEEVLTELPSEWFWVKRPRHFTYHNMDEVLEAAHRMGEDEEGYVCMSTYLRGDSFVRMKVKGDVYLSLHKMRGNGIPTRKRILAMWQEDSLDDFLAYFPQFRPNVQEVLDRIDNIQGFLALYYNILWTKCDHNLKTFAYDVATYSKQVQSIMFNLARGRINNVHEGLKTMRGQALYRLLYGEEEKNFDGNH